MSSLVAGYCVITVPTELILFSTIIPFIVDDPPSPGNLLHPKRTVAVMRIVEKRNNDICIDLII
jgi:hypothetical protein